MSENVIPGTLTESTHLQDGGLVLTIKVDKDSVDKASFLLNELYAPVALVRIKGEASDKGRYGHYAKALHRSAFFRTQQLWQILGTDQQFLEWLKTQRCAISNCAGTEDNQIIPAHVRRVANGAGTGIKPPYSAIPLTNTNHQLQHQHGEEYFYPREWWDKKRIEYVSLWAKERFKLAAQVESLADLSPEQMRDVSKNLGVYHLVPAIYKERT